MSNDRNFNPDQGEKENKKVILLDLSRTERAFEESESLWDIEIEKIEDRLTDHIASLEKYKDEKEPHKKPMLAIAVLGYPGSGKTSMLHTLVERVEKRKFENVSSLPVIKPNLVAEGDHFLYAFLAEALRMDREKHKHENDQDRETPFISRVQHKFQEVSEYLQVLNKTDQKHEGDPLGVSLERLERHESGLMLIEKMTGFIDELVNSLGAGARKSVLLLPVDDADMSKEVLNSALDTCWRFIKHPRLVPIFTFSGRLAEELMRVNYHEKLNSGSTVDDLKETSTSMRVTENMAIQHLGKLFPVRNRIKMGLAAARVQVADYRPLKGGALEKVSCLLKTASILLFGHAHEPIVHPIRPPLRVVTLRRQIQIIDAVQGVGLEKFMNNCSRNPGDKDPEEKSNSWGRLYDLTAWSLLNAHRDVLREINLNLDDLYGWTPKGLRQVVLDSILSRGLTERGKLIKHWRYRTEDRRSQVISLLAANVFRPLMAEEPSADDGIDVIETWWKDYTEEKGICPVKDQRSFSTLAGTLWFLNLCIGFYLPQALAWKWLDRTGEMEKGNRVTGIGWDSLSGPTHAVREAINNKKVFSSGILFLEPEQFDDSIKDNTGTKNKRFFSHIWCSYGFHEGCPWAAVSLWHGLGLMGKIIDFYENHRKYVKKDDELEKGITKIIRKHFSAALVSSNLPTGKEIERFEHFKYDNWEYKEEKKGDADSMENKISDFTKAVKSWLEANSPGEAKDDKKNRIYPMDERRDWESCFTRRLHGENLMSVFWQKLENVYYKKGLGTWNAGMILYQWKKLLGQYWDGCRPIKELLESCPIWPDYKSDGHDYKFDWGAVTVSPVQKYEEEVKNAKTQFAAGYKNKDAAALGKLKDEYIRKLDKEKKLADEIYEKGEEKNIKNINTYNLIVEEEYNRKIGMSRVKFENYSLFSEKQIKSNSIRSSTIPVGTKSETGKEIPSRAAVSNKKEEQKEGKNETGAK